MDGQWLKMCSTTERACCLAECGGEGRVPGWLQAFGRTVQTQERGGGVGRESRAAAVLGAGSGAQGIRLEVERELSAHHGDGRVSVGR